MKRIPTSERRGDKADREQRHRELDPERRRGRAPEARPRYVDEEVREKNDGLNDADKNYESWSQTGGFLRLCVYVLSFCVISQWSASSRHLPERQARLV